MRSRRLPPGGFRQTVLNLTGARVRARAREVDDHNVAGDAFNLTVGGVQRVAKIFLAMVAFSEKFFRSFAFSLNTLSTVVSLLLVVPARSIF